VTREEWLALALDRIRSALIPELPAGLLVSIGFPSKGATSVKRRVIGQCWSATTTANRKPAIFVSPVVKNAAEALGVLMHEACHAVTPGGSGHGPAFQGICKRLGLVKRGTWSNATPGPELGKRLNAMMREPFGHAAITVAGMTRTQSTRLLKAQCAGDGYTVRVTRRWLDALGWPVCPCGRTMTGDDD
jgi:hypothetical protein